MADGSKTIHKMIHVSKNMLTAEQSGSRVSPLMNQSTSIVASRTSAGASQRGERSSVHMSGAYQGDSEESYGSIRVFRIWIRGIHNLATGILTKRERVRHKAGMKIRNESVVAKQIETLDELRGLVFCSEDMLGSRK